MKLKSIILSVLASLAVTVAAQPVQQQEEWEWYLDEVVGETFVGRNYFDYYYLPSASDMLQQRERGEVTYFLNSPEGLNTKKVRDMIDRLMASYDDIKAVTGWQMTSATYWKEFRYEKNKFRFSVKRKMLDDGTYYVSVTETAGYYKSLGKGKKDESQAKETADKPRRSRSTKRSTRSGRHQVVDPDEAVTTAGVAMAALAGSDDEVTDEAPVMSEKERRRQAREQKEAEEQAERARLRRAQEKRREEAKAKKEAEKQRKAEEKQKKEEEKRLKKEEEKRQREQERKEREQERRNQAAAPKPVESKHHYTDVALWLSEKYDFMQTGAGESSCTMYSTAVKDVEMAKLTIKNALKGSNARMAVPWRVNSETKEIETGYVVDGHVLVFTIGKDEDAHVTLTITEVSAEEFEVISR